METKTLQEQIDKFYKETGYQLEVRNGKPYYGRSLYFAHTNITELPDNLVVGGSLDLGGTNIAKLPNNLIVGGSLYLYNTNIIELPDNLIVGGCLDLIYTKITKLPDNLVVGESIFLHYIKIAELPDNFVVGGSLVLRGTDITELPDNLVVGGCLDLYESKITKLPDNLVVGGLIFGVSSTPITPTLNQEVKAQKIRNFLQWNVGGKTYIKVDGIFSIVDSHKGNVWITHLIGEDETLCVVTDGEGHYAHGNTLKEAKADLIYKINDRDTSSYENLSLDDEISFEDAIAMYRTITGACSAGTRDFVEKRLPKPHKEKYTIMEIIDLTKGEYGSERLRGFFKCYQTTEHSD